MIKRLIFVLLIIPCIILDYTIIMIFYTLPKWIITGCEMANIEFILPLSTKLSDIINL